MFFLLFLCLFFNKIGEQEGRTGSAWRQGWREVVQIMYTHEIICKNAKMIFKKRKRKSKQY
jgi:hypothetical protein